MEPYLDRGRGNLQRTLQISITGVLNPFMPAGTYMYRQRVNNSNFSHFDETSKELCRNTIH